MDRQKDARKTTGMEMPPRSRLYHLPPCDVGTVWVESLTSYINRLAWMYRVSSRLLVAQAIVPQLSSEQQIPSFAKLATFSRSSAMGLNQTGDMPPARLTILQTLTSTPHLTCLT